jgi:dihydroflavonol-4-reductase
MKILVTGATGFVGNVLLEQLPKSFPEAEISAFVLPDDPRKIKLQKDKSLRIIDGDITKKNEVDNAVKGQTHVIHLAGLISYRKKDAKKLMEVNKTGVDNIVEACIKHKIQKLVHISSVGAFGFKKSGSLSTEDTPFNWPKNFVYMASKYEGQKIVERAAREKGLKAVILNPASIMGPGDPNLSTPHNQLYDRIYKGTFFGCFRGGLAVVDVRDLVSIIIKSLSSERYRGKYLVVGANVKYSQVLKTIARHAKMKVYPFPIPAFLLIVAGFILELLSSITNRKPLLTHAYGRLSGWKTYYSSQKSKKEFNHSYIPFEKTIKDSCEYFEKTFLRRNALKERR